MLFVILHLFDFKVKTFLQHWIFTACKQSLRQGNIFAPVCHSVHKGGSASVHAGITSPQEQTSPRNTQPLLSTPQDQAPPRSRSPSPREHTPWDQATPREPGTPLPPEQAPPCAVHAGRYGQQAGGMHPTWMQSCFLCKRFIELSALKYEYCSFHIMSKFMSSTRAHSEASYYALVIIFSKYSSFHFGFFDILILPQKKKYVLAANSGITYNGFMLQ